MKEEKQPKRPLVQDTAEALRSLILECEPQTYLGSLSDVAEKLGVGIVTVQQAARILEHEGLLEVKRGPGGGYYGTRPDDAAIERAFATYMRVHQISYKDAFEITILLDCEIIREAANSSDPAHLQRMQALMQQLQACRSGQDSIQFELDLRHTLLQAFNRPLLELLSRVAMQLYLSDSDPTQFAELFGLENWHSGRLRILQAICKNDPELAYFEAQRFRTMVHSWIHDGYESPSAARNN